MNDVYGWIFTIGGIIGFLTLLFHSLLIQEKDSTAFIFLGGGIMTFVLEYTLSVSLELYTYQNLPLNPLEIPIIIPMGWVITFYGLYNMSLDVTSSDVKAIGVTGVLGLLFGIGIESLARSSNFWIFNFSFTEILGIPINVILAWGFSTANFSAGIYLYDRYKIQYNWIWFPILLFVHIGNVTIALGLTAF